MDDLRPDALATIEAFDISDVSLASTIGSKDGKTKQKILFILSHSKIIGNPYEKMFKAAIQSPLNKQDPFPGYNEYLEPHLNKEFLKLKNTVPPKL
jgi:Acyl-CoA oxidase